MENVQVSHGSNQSKTTKLLENINSAALAKEAKRVEEKYGFNPESVWSKADDYGFSLKKAKRSIRENLAKTRFREEAGSSLSAGGVLIRYGVQKYMNSAYTLADSIVRDISYPVVSKTDEEWYAQVHRVDIPVVVDIGEDIPQRQAQIRSKLLRNKKFAAMLSIQKELLDDDQTGQVGQLAGQQGENMAYAQEKEGIVNFFAFTTSGDESVQKDGSGKQLTQYALEQAWNALRLVKDLNGNYIVVKPDSLIVHSSDEIEAKKLMQSMYQPSQPYAVAGGATSATQTGFTLTENILKGMFTIYASPLVALARAGTNATYNPWAIFARGKGFVFQTRSPIEVVQEAPNSGGGFLSDTYRWKVETRCAIDFVDGRQTYYGN